jgi:hypothetical protein
VNLENTADDCAIGKHVEIVVIPLAGSISASVHVAWPPVCLTLVSLIPIVGVGLDKVLADAERCGAAQCLEHVPLCPRP